MWKASTYWMYLLRTQLNFMQATNALEENIKVNQLINFDFRINLHAEIRAFTFLTVNLVNDPACNTYFMSYVSGQ